MPDEAGRPAGRLSGRRVLPALVTLLVLLWTTSALAVLAVASRDGAAPADVIVVLGAAQYRGRPSPILRERLETALRLWRAGVAPTLLLTGGTHAGDTQSEASVGRAYVLARGVPESAILLEHDGRTTRESLRAAAAVMRAHDLRTAVLVSDPFHLLRARILARKAGVPAHTSPAGTRGVGAWLAAAPGYFLSESIKAPVALLVQ